MKALLRIVDIDVSAPLRRKIDIQHCVELSENYAGVITGVPARKNPFITI